MNQLVADCIFSGRNPCSQLRQALVGRSCGVHFQFDTAQRRQLQSEGVSMLVCGAAATPSTALNVLQSITPDPDAGRAPRDDMVKEFESLDRAIPRPTGQITISRITLPDQPTEPADPQITLEVGTRWVEHSRLRRAALAALHHPPHRPRR